MTRSRKERKSHKQRLKQEAAASRQRNAQYPICPDCGRRHAPDTDGRDDDASDSVHSHKKIPAGAEPDGVHAMLSADPNEGPETHEEMSKAFLRKMRQPPLWDQLVEKVGPEKAKKVLRQLRTELP